MENVCLQMEFVLMELFPLEAAASRTTPAREARTGTATPSNVNVLRALDGVEKNVLSALEDKSGTYSKVALVLKATSWLDPNAKSLLSICAMSSPTPIGITPNSFVSANKDTQLSAISVSAEVSPLKDSATAAHTDLTQSSTLEYANVTMDIPWLVLNACPM